MQVRQANGVRPMCAGDGSAHRSADVSGELASLYTKTALSDCAIANLLVARRRLGDVSQRMGRESIERSHFYAWLRMSVNIVTA